MCMFTTALLFTIQTNGYISTCYFKCVKNIDCKMIINNHNYHKYNSPNYKSYDKFKNNEVNYKSLIQGDSLKTWSYKSPFIDQVQVKIASQGRPVDSDIELWQGPNNTPYKMRVYVENGARQPFHAVIETPRGPNTLAIKNIGQIEFPIQASVKANNIINPSYECLSSFKTIQGGALRTYSFNTIVENVQVMLKTDGRPLNSRIEVLQGPHNNKQVIELYTDDGCDRPFFCILETPGTSNVIRVLNTAPIEFPLFASVTPNYINKNSGINPTNTGDVFMREEFKY